MAEEKELSREEMQSVVFAQLVMQQSNLAFMLLGKTPHPETGKTVRDLDAAQMFIDQLEMLEAKTKGNLNSHETALLKQSLMSLRMAFVEAVNAPEPAAQSEVKPASQPESAAPENPPAGPEKKSPPADVAGEDESAKRFSKKYSL
jgi:hypothetical protein